MLDFHNMISIHTNKPLVITNLLENISFNEAFNQEFNSFQTDWYGTELSFRHDFSIISDLNSIFFIVQSNAPYSLDALSKANEFKEGLWEYSACELFIKDRNSDFYLEFNLAPNSAWWYCELVKYRERNETQNLLNKNDVITYQNSKSEFWQVGIKFPKNILPKEFSFNVCAILGKGDIFLSAKSIKDIEPDFHLGEII